MGLGLFIETLWDMPLLFFSVVATVVFSITVHELAHGFMAVRVGDRTPIDTGHLTIDPLVHMGPMALVALMIAGIAWGAMPIDPTRMKGRYAEALVSAAGPASNLVMALVVLVTLGVWMNVAGPIQADVWWWVEPVRAGSEHEDQPFWQNLRFFLFVFGSTNLALCLFNLLPVPPLDGSHILANFHRGYGRFIGDPANQGVMMIAFLFAFMAGARLFGIAFDWSLGIVAGVGSMW